MLESDILDAAIESLERLSHVHVEIIPMDQSRNQQGGKRIKPKANNSLGDFSMDQSRNQRRIKIKAGNTFRDFSVEVKSNVTPAHLPRLVNKNHKVELLVARQFSAKAISMLEANGVNYLDVAGNCYITTENGLYIRVKGMRLPEEYKEKKHKAFSKNGIKLIYGLLLDETLINVPYRTMANNVDISPSTVGSILEDLANLKFLYQKNETTKLIANKKDLLDQWATAFHQKLRGKLVRGKYRFLDQLVNWKDLDLGTKAYWGGEPAADLLTNYLHPGFWTIYTNLESKTIIKDFRLVPDMKQGNIEVLQFFWNTENEKFITAGLQIVHPLLVYADLIGSSNSRNLETANKIYEQYLKNLIE